MAITFSLACAKVLGMGGYVWATLWMYLMEVIYTEDGISDNLYVTYFKTILRKPWDVFKSMLK